MPVPPGKKKITVYVRDEFAQSLRLEAHKRHLSQGDVLEESFAQRVISAQPPSALEEAPRARKITVYVSKDFARLLKSESRHRGQSQGLLLEEAMAAQLQFTERTLYRPSTMPICALPVYQLPEET